MNESDAKKINLKDFDKVKVTSQFSSLVSEMKIDKRMPEGIVGAHFHFEKLLIYKLLRPV